ncbi:MAG TPA: J domain-containing protein [Pyrinomonadaceae bacterium]|nr:J domain-containing protein [Pyrinomonadaceae bacterium]
MSSDLKAYEVLGVKPGVSNTELKAAHRDLAKVWHPDRFLHDPRLQAKAQEKLKEINQAYEQLLSGKTPRPVPPPQQARQEQHAGTVPSRRGSAWQGFVVALLLFVAVFAVATRALLQKRNQPLQEQEAPAEQSTTLEQDRAKRPEPGSRAEVNDVSRKENREEPAPEAVSVEAVVTQPTPALATVTVTIDPESGLLAKPGCPLRSRMTYPSGSAPAGYCNISHAPLPKESRIKSIATKIKGIEDD